MHIRAISSMLGDMMSFCQSPMGLLIQGKKKTSGQILRSFIVLTWIRNGWGGRGDIRDKKVPRYSPHNAT